MFHQKPTRNHRMDQLLHKTFDWKCRRCFRDQNSVKPITIGNRCTGNSDFYRLITEIGKIDKINCCVKSILSIFPDFNDL